VPPTVDQQTIVTLQRPPRARCLVDLRSKIRLVVDTATLAEPTTGRRRATEGDLAPRVERLNVLPSLRRLPISTPIAANGIAKRPDPPRRTEQRSEPPLPATVERQKLPEPVTVPATRSRNRRLMFALPFALVFAALPLVPWQGHRPADTIPHGSADNSPQPKLELSLAQPSPAKVVQPPVDIASEVPARAVESHPALARHSLSEASVETAGDSTPAQGRKPTRRTPVAVPTRSKAASPEANTAPAVPLRL
jgi:hypothetical protein